MSNRLFAHPERQGPRRPSPPAPLLATPAAAKSADPVPELLAILAEPPALGETYDQAFRRKELAFIARCSALPVLEAMALYKRLANPRPDDPLAAQFGRLVVERRNRIVHFLADARRRAALATSR